MKAKALLCCLLLAAFIVLAGCAAVAPGREAAVEAPEAAGEAPAESSEPAGPAVIDLSAPDTAAAGVSYEDGVFTVTQAGVFRVTGRAAARLVVDADGPVELVLAGAEMQAPEAIRVASKHAVRITAEAGTGNTLYDGIEAPDEEATAVILSKGPLTIGGDGRLTVLAGGNNGIRCQSPLVVESGTLTVRAADNGLKSEGSVTISGGTVDITCGGDGLKAEAGRLGAGDVTVTGGTVTVAATGRGVDAEGTVWVTGGSLSVTTADDGVKGGTVLVYGGSVTAASALDGVQSAGDLTVSGGELSVTAGEDGLRGANVSIQAGTVALDAVGDGVQADMSLTVSGGEVNVTAGEDGLRADAVYIREGAVTLETTGDGVQGDTLVSVEGGRLAVTAGGGGGGAINRAGESWGPWSRSSDTTAASDVSAKGLKSAGDITISGSVIDLSTADDAIHAAVLCTISGGDVTVVATDDGIHSDDMLVIEDGVVNIADSFEGLEAFAIEIRGGDVAIRAVNDGINANGSEFFGRSRSSQQSAFTSVSGYSDTYLYQSGGKVDIVVTGNSSNLGDGIDSNGYVTVAGGELTVSTKGGTMEGGIDTGRSGPTVTGGMVMAGGSSMMQESWTSSSTQCCAVVTTSLQSAGTTVTIYDEGGEVVWSVTLANEFNCLVLSHPGLEPGHVYTLDYGGGTQTLDFTSSTVLRVGSGRSGGFGFR